MNVKKAILTGGGRATRLRPITTTINKHLIPLAGKPMIVHAIEKVVEAGIEEIFISTNPGETQIKDTVGNGKKWGVSITYFEQTGGPQGIAHVVKCAEKFIGTDSFMFYLSDNIILGSLVSLVKKFETENLDCLLTLSKVPDPERFGVPEFNSEGKLVDVIEKPVYPSSNFAVTGIYIYNQNFFKAFDHIEKSDRGEYEISSIHSYFLKNDYTVGHQEITGWWKDTGKPYDLISANQLLLDLIPDDQFTHSLVETVGAKIEGKVQLGTGTILRNSVTIRGPVIIGERCSLENCTIGPYVTIGDDSTIKRIDIKESLVFGKCKIDVPIKISQSIIGDQAQLVKNDEVDYHRLILGDFTVIEF
jgi:glucose-1-phosphate thymidylyltransferase